MGEIRKFLENDFFSKIANGEIVNKESDYKEEKEQKTSVITNLIKALKLIKNMLG